MGIIGEGEFLLQPCPFRRHVRQNLEIRPVDVGKVHILIMGAGIKAQFAKFPGGNGLFPVHAGDVGGSLAPHGKLQMQPLQPLPHAFLPEPVDLPAGRVNASQTPHQIGHVVDHENRLAVNGVIIGLREVIPNHMGHGPAEFGRVLSPLPDYRVQIPAVALVPQLHRVVIGPHQVEFHLPVVLGLQKTVVQTVLQKRPAIVPVPVVYKNVHAVVHRGGNFHLHYVGIRFVHISPQGPARPGVPRKLGARGLHRLPFPHALRPENPGAGLVAGIGRPDVGGHVVFTLCQRKSPPRFCLFSLYQIET